VPGRGPRAITDGYSTMGSQANSVALNPAGTWSGGKRFSVCGPVFAGSAANAGSATRSISTVTSNVCFFMGANYHDRRPVTIGHRPWEQMKRLLCVPLSRCREPRGTQAKVEAAIQNVE